MNLYSNCAPRLVHSLALLSRTESNVYPPRSFSKFFTLAQTYSNSVRYDVNNFRPYFPNQINYSGFYDRPHYPSYTPLGRYLSGGYRKLVWSNYANFSFFGWSNSAFFHHAVGYRHHYPHKFSYRKKRKVRLFKLKARSLGSSCFFWQYRPRRYHLFRARYSYLSRFRSSLSYGHFLRFRFKPPRSFSKGFFFSRHGFTPFGSFSLKGSSLHHSFWKQFQINYRRVFFTRFKRALIRFFLLLRRAAKKSFARISSFIFKNGFRFSNFIFRKFYQIGFSRSFGLVCFSRFLKRYSVRPSVVNFGNWSWNFFNRSRKKKKIIKIIKPPLNTKEKQTLQPTEVAPEPRRHFKDFLKRRRGFVTPALHPDRSYSPSPFGQGKRGTRRRAKILANFYKHVKRPRWYRGHPTSKGSNFKSIPSFFAAASWIFSRLPARLNSHNRYFFRPLERLRYNFLRFGRRERRRGTSKVNYIIRQLLKTFKTPVFSRYYSKSELRAKVFSFPNSDLSPKHPRFATRKAYLFSNYLPFFRLKFPWPLARFSSNPGSVRNKKTVTRKPLVHLFNNFFHSFRSRPFSSYYYRFFSSSFSKLLFRWLKIKKNPAFFSELIGFPKAPISHYSKFSGILRGDKFSRKVFINHQSFLKLKAFFSSFQSVIASPRRLRFGKKVFWGTKLPKRARYLLLLKLLKSYLAYFARQKKAGKLDLLVGSPEFKRYSRMARLMYSRAFFRRFSKKVCSSRFKRLISIFFRVRSIRLLFLKKISRKFFGSFSSLPNKTLHASFKYFFLSHLNKFSKDRKRRKKRRRVLKVYKRFFKKFRKLARFSRPGLTSPNWPVRRLLPFVRALRIAAWSKLMPTRGWRRRSRFFRSSFFFKRFLFNRLRSTKVFSRFFNSFLRLKFTRFDQSSKGLIANRLSDSTVYFHSLASSQLARLLSFLITLRAFYNRCRSRLSLSTIHLCSYVRGPSARMATKSRSVSAAFISAWVSYYKRPFVSLGWLQLLTSAFRFPTSFYNRGSFRFAKKALFFSTFIWSRVFRLFRFFSIFFLSYPSKFARWLFGFFTSYSLLGRISRARFLLPQLFALSSSAFTSRSWSSGLFSFSLYPSSRYSHKKFGRYKKPHFIKQGTFSLS